MNLANRITLLRIFLIPIFMFFLLSNIPNGMLISAVIFLLASSTDALDGYIARKRNEVTNFGKFLDPLADKLLISTALISLVQLGKIPAFVVIIIIAREFTITILRALASAQGVVIAASMWGKLKTITQIVSIFLILIDNFPFSYINIPMDTIMIWISVVFTIISGIDYIIINKDIIK